MHTMGVHRFRPVRSAVYAAGGVATLLKVANLSSANNNGALALAA